MAAHAFGQRLLPCATRKKRAVKRPIVNRPKSYLPPWQVLAVGARIRHGPAAEEVRPLRKPGRRRRAPRPLPYSR